MGRDCIEIQGLRVDCVVGVYPAERHRPQPLVVDVALWLDTEKAAARERLRDTVDYARLAAQIDFILRSSMFRMLETAAHALCRYLLSPPGKGERRARVSAARVKLEKPDAMLGAAMPSLTVERDAEWATFSHEDKSFGVVDIIHETRDAGIYRLNLAPGGRIPLHHHRQMRESEMVLTSGLLCQGKPVAAGTAHRWPLGAAHGYDNPTARWQSILCIDCPPFIEADEIPVQGEPAFVQPEAPWPR